MDHFGPFLSTVASFYYTQGMEKLINEKSRVQRKEAKLADGADRPHDQAVG